MACVSEIRFCLCFCMTSEGFIMVDGIQDAESIIVMSGFVHSWVCKKQ